MNATSRIVHVEHVNHVRPDAIDVGHLRAWKRNVRQSFERAFMDAVLSIWPRGKQDDREENAASHRVMIPFAWWVCRQALQRLLVYWILCMQAFMLLS